MPALDFAWPVGSEAVDSDQAGARSEGAGTTVSPIGPIAPSVRSLCHQLWTPLAAAVSPYRRARVPKRAICVLSARLRFKSFWHPRASPRGVLVRSSRLVLRHYEMRPPMTDAGVWPRMPRAVVGLYGIASAIQPSRSGLPLLLPSHPVARCQCAVWSDWSA